MIKVELFISPSLSIEKLSEPLSQIGVISLSSIDMKIFGSETKSQTSYRGVQRSGKHSNRTKLEIILPSLNQTILFKMLKEILGPEESLVTPVFITPIKPVDSLQHVAMA